MNSTYDREVRGEQQREGQRMARDDFHPMDRSRPTLHARRGGSRKAAGPKGHEAFLKQLEESKSEIVLEKMSGEKVQGVVKHSDKFTITVRVDDGDKAIDRVIFKHDISEFRALHARRVEGDDE